MDAKQHLYYALGIMAYAVAKSDGEVQNEERQMIHKIVVEESGHEIDFDYAEIIFSILQKEKQEAERKRVEAQGIADYQRIISLGLTDKQLQYEQIKAQKEIATSPNTKIIFMGKGSAPVILSDK
jgi:hypothetical protein